MIVSGQRLILAVSGGSDSVGLLLLLEDLQARLGTTLAVAHFNHQLRGAAADCDEDFVRDLAARHGLECLVRREDVAAEARRAGSNLEQEARSRRYAFFRELTHEDPASLVATGHTADDQAETVLARLARGTGLRGLGAIHPVLGPIVRPLLDVRRAELREYLAARGQRWREDKTNQDVLRLRTRIRCLLPALQGECGQGLVANLGRLAEQARVDEALLGGLVEERYRALASRRTGMMALAARDLAHPWPALESAAANAALAARLVRRVAEEMQGGLQRLTANHVERVLQLARHGTSGDRVELPAGLSVERTLDQLLFFMNTRPRSSPQARLVYSYVVDPWRGGEVTLSIAETGKRLRLKLVDWPSAGRETYSVAGALDADRLEPPLVVRNWLPGDAYRPSGRGRVLKLKRLLLDRRVAHRDRMGWPVLTSGGRPIWASGLAVAAELAASQRTRKALLVHEEAKTVVAADECADAARLREASKRSGLSPGTTG